MARAKKQTTQYPGVYKRETAKLGRVYDFTYRDANGKQKWVDGKHTNLAAANAHRLELLHEIRHGRSPTAKAPTTLRAFAGAEWVPRLEAQAAQGKIKHSTLAAYKAELTNHVLPALGDLLLGGIDVDRVERFATELLAAGKSPDTTIRIVNTLGYVMKHALKRGLIPHNPVSIADKPTTTRRTPELPTLAQVYALAAVAPRREAGNLVLFAAFTGIRKSELFGLRWSSLNLTEGIESVRITEQYYKGRVTDTKTAAGRREEILGREAARVIRDHSALQQIDQRPNPHGLVFPAPEGGYWEARNFQARCWNTMREAVELPSLMFHTLRYFFISNVRESSGLPASVTQQIVGHADARTHTAYTRPTEGTEQLIRNGLASVFARPAEA